MPLTICYKFEMHDHIAVKMSFPYIRHKNKKIISRILRLLVVGFMQELLVIITSTFTKIPVKEFFLVMLPILINVLYGMTKILGKSKLLLTINLMRVSMISPLTIHLPSINIFFNRKTNVCQLIKMNYQHQILIFCVSLCI